MKTYFSFSSVCTMVLFFFMSLNGCKEGIIDNEAQPPLNSNDSFVRFDKIAPEMYQKITADYEDYGRVVYTHFKYHPVDDPSEYIPKQIRSSTLKVIEEIELRDKGLSIDERLNRLAKNNMISEKTHQLYSSFFSDVSEEFERTSSPKAMWVYLRNYEKKLELLPEEQGAYMLLVYSSMMRNYIKYEWEQHEIQNFVDIKKGKGVNKKSTARTAGCFLGITGSCWANIIGNAAVTAITAAVTGGVSAAIANKAVWEAAKIAAATTGATSLIKNTITSYSNGGCGCGEVAVSCAQPQGFKLIIEDCSLTHTFQVVGGGTAANNFHYSVQNGYFPEFSNSSSVSYTGAKSIKVTQSDPNVPVLLTATVACSDGGTPSYSAQYNIYERSRDPEPVGVYGPVNINVQDPSNWTYYSTTGNDIVNTNNTHIWSRNWAGQTVEGGNNNDGYIKIKWIHRTTSMDPGKVYLQSQNQCSGQEAVKSVSVNVY